MTPAMQTQPKPGTAPVSYVRADDTGYRDRLFQLRHDCYVRDGIAAPLDSRRMNDAYDELANAHLFGVEVEGELVASIRLHVCDATQRGSPSHSAFADILDPILDRGESYVDPTRFVVARRIVNSTFLAVSTIRLAAMAAEHFKVNYVLATPRAEHFAFYRRFCSMEALAEPRPYPPLTRELGLMSRRRIAIDDMDDRQRRLFETTLADRARLFSTVDPVDLAA